MEIVSHIFSSLADLFFGTKGWMLLVALSETFFMVSLASLIGVVAGVPLGICLFNSSKQGLKPDSWLYQLLSGVVNSLRSIPYIILIVLLIPVTRLLVGTSIGTIAAIFPLCIAAILLIARVVEETFQNLPRTYIEIGLSFSASPQMIYKKILLPETLPTLVAHITTIVINIVGFSAMAGTVGGGGLGDLAIRYGYQRYDVTLVVAIVFILIALVHVIQISGNRIVNRLRK